MERRLHVLTARQLDRFGERIRRPLRLLKPGDDLLVSGRPGGEAVLAERPLRLGCAYSASETTQGPGPPGGAALQAPAQLKKAATTYTQSGGRLLCL